MLPWKWSAPWRWRFIVGRGRVVFSVHHVFDAAGNAWTQWATFPLWPRRRA